MLLQAFYSIRSERLLMERLEYDPLFRCFVGVGVGDAAWDHSSRRIQNAVAVSSFSTS
jgi:transposase